MRDFAAPGDVGHRAIGAVFSRGDERFRAGFGKAVDEAKAEAKTSPFKNLVPTLCVGTHCFATLLRRGLDAVRRTASFMLSRALCLVGNGVQARRHVRNAGASRSSAFPRRAWERVLEGTIPIAAVDINRQNRDAVRLGVADQLRRLVETHRLAVQERGRERGGVMALQPRRDVGEPGETGGVRFGKAVFAEAADLLVDLVGELGRKAARQKTVAELGLELLDLAGPFPGGHGAAQLIRLAGSKARCHDRQPHHLLLKERHAERLGQHLFDERMRIGHRFFARPPPQIRMHHAALNRSGPYNGDLHDEIVKASRLQARQHRHLRPALDLEDADGIGRADHVIDNGILRGDACQREFFLYQPGAQATGRSVLSHRPVACGSGLVDQPGQSTYGSPSACPGSGNRP